MDRPWVLCALLIAGHLAAGPRTAAAARSRHLQQACDPGTYRDGAGACVECGWHAYCLGGEAPRTPCTPWTGTNTTTAAAATDCQVLSCNPCPDAAPKIYFSTGGGPDVTPKNALWVTNTNVDPSVATAVGAHFLCNMTLADNQQLSDVAVAANGDVLVIDTGGLVYRLSAKALAVLAATDATGSTYKRPCNESFEPADRPYYFKLGGGTWTGLSWGFRTDVLFGTTNNGQVSNIVIKDPTSIKPSQINPIGLFPTGLNPDSWKSSETKSNGGSDVTPGPDGSAYRWSARDAGHWWSGHKIAVDPTTLLMTGSATWTNRGVAPDDASVDTTPLSFQNEYSNGGAFCTHDHVWAAVIHQVDHTSYSAHHAAFFRFGEGGPVAASGNSLISSNAAVRGPVEISDELMHWSGVSGSTVTSVFKPNGAAVQPRCQTAFTP